jgi:hypothetical protein
MRTLPARVALCVLVAAACRAAPAETETTTHDETATSVIESAAPLDHLAPGELLEGAEHAFGVVLPRNVAIRGAFVDVVYASGSGSVEDVARYFRARLRGGSVREGPLASTFEHVTAPGRPEVDLQVRVMADRGQTSVEIRDTTAAPVPVLPDEASRWKQVGLTPSGRLADPTHLD